MRLLRHMSLNPVLLSTRLLLHNSKQMRMLIVDDAPDIEVNSARLTYLPHHTVIKSDKGITKVYDASANVGWYTLPERYTNIE